MERRDPLLRAAQRLAQALDERHGGGTAALPSAYLSDLLDTVRMAERLDRLRRRALDRGWPLAAKLVAADVLREVRAANHLAGVILGRSTESDAIAAAATPPPSLGCLVEDLRQLTEEFEEVQFDLKAGRIVATTRPVELEEVSLGPFAIELHLGRLADRRDSSCFDCVALQPHPASGNASVTHPHVQDRQLCAGDASAPIAAALRQGRICDAFCLVRSVLQTYNRASPYVALDAWDGVTCGDCGRSSSRDNTSGCANCDRDYCDECVSCCEACDGTCCRGCLERDEEADTNLCPACRTNCDDCGRVANVEDVEGAPGLCPQCRERPEQQEQEGEGEEAEEAHEHHTLTENQHDTDLGPPGDAGQPAAAAVVPATLAEQPPQTGTAAA